MNAQPTAVIEIAGVELCVNDRAFLDERSIANAAVVETRDGGFAIRIEYDRHGSLILDTVTTENRGRKIAIFTQYGTGKPDHSRWLAAPYGTPITNGVLLFTPWASRRESEQIVLGLLNVAKKARR